MCIRDRSIVPQSDVRGLVATLRSLSTTLNECPVVLCLHLKSVQWLNDCGESVQLSYACLKELSSGFMHASKKCPVVQCLHLESVSCALPALSERDQ